MLPPTKRCASCQQDLPRASFYRNLASKSGLQGSCIPCQLERERARRALGIRKVSTGRVNRVGTNYAYEPRKPATAAEDAALALRGLRRCLACQEVKPRDADHFRRRGARLTRRCLACLAPPTTIT